MGCEGVLDPLGDYKAEQVVGRCQRNCRSDAFADGDLAFRVVAQAIAAVRLQFDKVDTDHRVVGDGGWGPRRAASAPA